MKIQILSDLHFEFHADGGKSFVESLDFSGSDVLVLAGDISNASGISYALELFCENFKKQIFFVAGNHEYYGAGKWDLRRKIYDCDIEYDNFEWLDSTAFTYEGYRFIGATMWFKEKKNSPHLHMNDFSAIEEFSNWVYKDNSDEVSFLVNEIQENDIVVTHHLPSYKSVHSKYKDSSLNCFFVNEMDDIIKSKRPKLWIHRHTHESVDTVIDKTRVVCNPYGYLFYETNPLFKEKLIIEV